MHVLLFSQGLLEIRAGKTSKTSIQGWLGKQCLEENTTEGSVVCASQIIQK